MAIRRIPSNICIFPTYCKSTILQPVASVAHLKSSIERSHFRYIRAEARLCARISVLWRHLLGRRIHQQPYCTTCFASPSRNRRCTYHPLCAQHDCTNDARTEAAAEGYWALWSIRSYREWSANMRAYSRNRAADIESLSPWNYNWRNSCRVRVLEVDFLDHCYTINPGSYRMRVPYSRNLTSQRCQGISTGRSWSIYSHRYVSGLAS
jgi:hypothetical protein